MSGGCWCAYSGVVANSFAAAAASGGTVGLQNSTIASAVTTASSFDVTVNVGPSGPRLFVLALGTTRDGSSPTGEVSSFGITATIGGTAMTLPGVENGTSWLNAAFTQGGRLEHRFIEESSLASSQTLTISFDTIGGVSGATSFSTAVTHSIVLAVFTLDTSFSRIDGFVGRGTGGNDSAFVTTQTQQLFFGASMALVTAATTPTWGGSVLSPSTFTPSSWVFDNCKMSFGYQVTEFTGVNSSDVSINWNDTVDYMWVASHGKSPAP